MDPIHIGLLLVWTMTAVLSLMGIFVLYKAARWHGFQAFLGVAILVLACLGVFIHLAMDVTDIWLQTRERVIKHEESSQHLLNL